MSLKRGLAPNCFVIVCAFKIGGISSRLLSNTHNKRTRAARIAPGYTVPMLEYEISPVDTVNLLRENKTRLIDVREPWEYSTARIEPSTGLNMPSKNKLRYSST